MSRLKGKTLKDEVLYQVIKDGWPSDRKQVPGVILPYFNYQQELSTFDGIILRDNCIVVPASMRKEMKNILQSGHLGIVKTKLRARDSLYWPGITKELENITQNCETCQEFRNKQKKELLLKHKIPDRPWSKVGTDLF